MEEIQKNETILQSRSDETFNPPVKQDVIRDEKGRFPKGVSGNINGKPPGTLDFKTKWLRFIDKVANANGITADEVDEQLLAVAFKKAKDANYQFYKDIHDRVYGQAKSNVEHSGSLTIAQTLDEIENGHKANNQKLEAETFIQDSGQEEESDKVQPQQSTRALQPEQVVEKYNTEK